MKLVGGAVGGVRGAISCAPLTQTEKGAYV